MFDREHIEYADSVPADVRRSLASLEPVVDSDAVEKAVDQLAVRLTIALQSSDPVFVTVLHGGSVLAGMPSFQRE